MTAQPTARQRWFDPNFQKCTLFGQKNPVDVLSNATGVRIWQGARSLSLSTMMRSFRRRRLSGKPLRLSMIRASEP